MPHTPVTRRDFLKSSVAAYGAAILPVMFNRVSGASPARAQTVAAFEDALPAFRAQLGAIPIQSTKLAENLTLLSGPGGNVLVVNGNDGKIVVDTFVQPAWPKLRESLAAIGPQPVKLVIDTHWHFDHADNNAAFRAEGIPILAHENVSRRMGETHNIELLHLHFPPTPSIAFPSQTFAKQHSFVANRERLTLEHVDPAHTDTDIYIHFAHANVIHCGDLVINNGGFPLIDYETGGKIIGMVEATNRILALADNKTRIIPGHGAITDKAGLVLYRDMLVTAHDRVGGLRARGKSLDEVVAAKPLDSLNAEWGKGLLNSDSYTKDVYRSL
jgi:cyclase